MDGSCYGSCVCRMSWRLIGWCWGERDAFQAAVYLMLCNDTYKYQIYIILQVDDLNE
jgi:hypothetical protein